MRSVLFLLLATPFSHTAISQTANLFVKTESSGFCAKTGNGGGEWKLTNVYPKTEVNVTLRYSVVNGGGNTVTSLVQHLKNGETKSLGCIRMVSGDRQFEVMKVELVGAEPQNGSSAP